MPSSRLSARISAAIIPLSSALSRALFVLRLGTSPRLYGPVMPPVNGGPRFPARPLLLRSGWDGFLDPSSLRIELFSALRPDEGLLDEVFQHVHIVLRSVGVGRQPRWADALPTSTIVSRRSRSS